MDSFLIFLIKIGANVINDIPDYPNAFVVPLPLVVLPLSKKAFVYLHELAIAS